jgi:hypothetical protein
MNLKKENLLYSYKFVAKHKLNQEVKDTASIVYTQPQQGCLNYTNCANDNLSHDFDTKYLFS